MSSPYDYYSYNYADDGSRVSTGLESDYEPTNIAWLLVGIVNGDWGGTCPDQSTQAGQTVPYPDPVFSYFPSRLSSLDILTLTRQYNGKLDGELAYTITVGGKTITGVMDGKRDKRQTSINRLDELKGIKALEMNLSIRNASGKEVVNTRIPLVPLSEVE